MKDVISILDVAERFSPKINTRAKRPQIICPFHSDKHLGSCRIYTDSNTFKCESCGAHGDTLTLASGYLDIPLSSMDHLLERMVSEFGLIRENVCEQFLPDNCSGRKKVRNVSVPRNIKGCCLMITSPSLLSSNKSNTKKANGIMDRPKLSGQNKKAPM